ncbi:ubiquinol-cytochrome c reductase iron-sulfur subunit [Bacillus sp. JCM 19041]|uniref:ubiquinol-cytochrome c reductase iron-sulfur subunit n=1 Tax=Bacillus sp. JCM 19041 TaxID=1460637 RepID=UPI0006D136CC
MSEREHKVSRRQFLSYTLTGVGGFMAAGMLMPMVRFALDPALKAGAETEMQTVCELDDLTDTPQRFTWSFNQVDSWYESTVEHEAYIYLDGDDVVALSSVCTHLGCTVGYNEDDNEFQCPCHGGRFTEDGTNVAGTPPTRPLDVFEVVVEDGKVLLGQVNRRD